MTPPAKKANPSLSSILNKNDNKDEKNEPTTEVDENENNTPDTEEEKNDNKEEQKTTFRPEEIDPPVDNTDVSDVNNSGTDDRDKADKPALSNQVVSTVPNKTPAELSSETPKQTAQRYSIDQSVTDEDADNPRVDVYRDTHVNQVPSGTHLHPDIAKDLLNRGITEQHTDNAQVKRTTTEYYDFAPNAEHNDKF